MLRRIIKDIENKIKEGSWYGNDNTELFDELLNEFLNEYVEIKNMNEEELSKLGEEHKQKMQKDIESVFEIMYSTFSDKEIEEEFLKQIKAEKNEETKEITRKEYTDYKLFITDLEYVLDNIKKIDILKIVNNNKLNESFKNVTNFLLEKRNGIEDLENTLKEMNDKLKKVEELLVNYKDVYINTPELLPPAPEM
tara:strand:+ start:573 stop:1157 length:585 start_codon:yes stop_codon:yes gene_type:complete